MTTTTEASTTGAQLLAAAEFLDAHPDLPRPFVTIYPSGTTNIAWYLDDDDQVDQARAIRRTIGGTWDKSTSDTTLYLRQRRDGLDLTVSCDRDAACVRRVVGVEAVTIPAVEAQPEQTVVREIVEWDCGPILGADLTKAGATA